MEMLVRRLLAVHAMDTSGNMNIARSIEYNSYSDTLLDAPMLKSIFKNDAAIAALRSGSRFNGGSGGNGHGNNYGRGSNNNYNSGYAASRPQMLRATVSTSSSAFSPSA